MPELDEISRAIGRLESKVDGIQQDIKDQKKSIQRIDASLTKTRVKVAGIAGTTAAGVYALIEVMKSKFGSH